jgi:hypothetical protein
VQEPVRIEQNSEKMPEKHYNIISRERESTRRQKKYPKK